VLVPVVLLLAAAAVFLVLRNRGPRDALAASGTVEATEAQLGFQASGRIQTVEVREGDRVRAGAELARLDRTEQEARHAQAVAQRAAAQAMLDELTRGARTEEIEQARAARDAAQKRFEDARLDRDRAQQLIQTGAVSQQAWDKARAAFEVAQAQLEQAEEQYRLVRTGPRRERVEAQRAQVAQAAAAERAMQAALDNLVVKAPFEGVVTVRHHEPGEVLAGGAPVLTVMNRDDRWVRIYVREDRVGAVRLGQPAAVTCDTWPGRTYRGEVVFIASEAEFTPRNVQTSEERVKLVYAVKVRIAGDPGYDLKPGMPADVRLETKAK
jgi:HlyD family secretion protein